MVSIDFSTQISINSQASGGSATRTPTNEDFQKFDKILNKFWKNREIFLKIV